VPQCAQGLAGLTGGGGGGGGFRSTIGGRGGSGGRGAAGVALAGGSALGIAGADADGAGVAEADAIGAGLGSGSAVAEGSIASATSARGLLRETNAAARITAAMATEPATSVQGGSPRWGGRKTALDACPGVVPSGSTPSGSKGIAVGTGVTVASRASVRTRERSIRSESSREDSARGLSTAF
jgi:hypothetical protein